MILALTSVPGASLPHASFFPEADKVVHFGLYAILGLLSTRATNKSDRGALTGIILGVLLFAALDEWHQQFVAGRSMDALDWGADAVGGVLGVWAFGMVRKRREQTT